MTSDLSVQTRIFQSPDFGETFRRDILIQFLFEPLKFLEISRLAAFPNPNSALDFESSSL